MKLRYALPGLGGASINVVTNRTPPQLFGDDVPVLLEDYWDAGTFIAPDGYGDGQ